MNRTTIQAVGIYGQPVSLKPNIEHRITELVSVTVLSSGAPDERDEVLLKVRVVSG